MDLNTVQKSYFDSVSSGELSPSKAAYPRSFFESLSLRFPINKSFLDSFDSSPLTRIKQIQLLAEEQLPIPLPLASRGWRIKKNLNKLTVTFIWFFGRIVAVKPMWCGGILGLGCFPITIVKLHSVRIPLIPCYFGRSGSQIFHILWHLSIYYKRRMLTLVTIDLHTCSVESSAIDDFINCVILPFWFLRSSVSRIILRSVRF